MPLVSATDVPIQPYPTGRTSPQAPDAYERIQTSPSMFGSIQAEALEKAGQQGEKLAGEIAKIGAYQQVLHNRIVTDQQTSSFEDKVNKVMYGDPEVPGDVGYMGLKGQAALDQRAPTRAKIDQILQEHRQALQNVQQQLAFDSTTRRYRNYLLTDVGRHYNAEYTRWGTEVTQGRANTALGNAGIAANNGDDNAWEVAFNTGRTALADGLTLLGHPPEYVAAEVAKYEEKAATDYAKKLAVRSPWLAGKFVDANRQYLPNTYDDLKRGFKVESDRILKDHIANGTPLPEGTSYQIQGGATVGPRTERPTRTYPGDAGDRVAATLRARGWSPAAIEGALNNSIAESSLNENATGAAGEKGLFQFHPASHIGPFTRAYGGNWSPEAQANYMADVVEQSIPGYTQSKDARQATADFLRGFEKPKDQSDAELNRRFANSGASRTIIGRGGAPIPAPSADGGTTPVPAAGAAAAVAPAIGNEIAVGDSIAAHLIRKAGVAGREDATTVANRRPGDTAVSGLGPNAIRDEVIPNMSDDDIRGKHVILSSGVTNKPGEIAAVAQQIQALRNRGATDITLLGVGNDPRLNGVNDKLAEIAAANNAAFAGPMRKVAGDKIHSDDNQDLLAQVREAKRPVPPDTPGAPPSTTAAASGEPAPVRVEPLAGAAAPAAPGQPALPEPDRLLRSLPEPEEGVLPDSELGAAYRKRLEDAAKRVPPGTSQEVWHGAVTQIRREMSWQIQLQRREAQIAEQQAKAAMHQAENEIYRDVYSANPKITPQQIATDPRFDIDPTRRRQMLELVNNPPGSAVPPAQSWAATQSLIERIRLPEGDPNKITDTGQIYDSMRLLNKPDFEFAMKQFNDIKAPGGQTLSKLRDDFVKRYSGFITKSNPMAGVVDAVGEARLYEFERYIDQQVDDYKKAGKDPTALFTDTGSPTFLGHESVIRRFQPTPEQSRQAISGMVGGSVTPLPPINRPEPPPAPPPFPIPSSPQRLPGGGVEVPLPPPPAATNDNDAARRPGESPDEYVRRRGL